jgi:hypothetical protein
MVDSGRIRLWLKALFRPGRVEKELEEEISLHVEMETQKNIRAGMDPIPRLCCEWSRGLRAEWRMGGKRSDAGVTFWTSAGMAACRSTTGGSWSSGWVESPLQPRTTRSRTSEPDSFRRRNMTFSR